MISIIEAIEIVESYKKYASEETVGALDSIVRELLWYGEDYVDGLAKQEAKKCQK